MARPVGPVAIDERDVSGQKHRLSVDDAEALTGFTKQQVSKWRRRLKERKKYADLLYSAAYAKAMASWPRSVPRTLRACSGWIGQQSAYGSMEANFTPRASRALRSSSGQSHASVARGRPATGASKRIQPSWRRWLGALTSAPRRPRAAVPARGASAGGCPAGSAACGGAPRRRLRGSARRPRAS